MWQAIAEHVLGLGDFADSGLLDGDGPDDCAVWVLIAPQADSANINMAPHTETLSRLDERLPVVWPCTGGIVSLRLGAI